MTHPSELEPVNYDNVAYIAYELRSRLQRIYGEGNVTVEPLLWDDGDYRVKAWHTMTQYTDGSFAIGDEKPSGLRVVDTYWRDVFSWKNSSRTLERRFRRRIDGEDERYKTRWEAEVETWW